MRLLRPLELAVLLLAVGACGSSSGDDGSGDAGGAARGGTAAASGKGTAGGAGVVAGKSGSSGTTGGAGAGAGAGGTSAAGGSGRDAGAAGAGSGGSGGSGGAQPDAGTVTTAPCKDSCGLFSCCDGACVNPGNDIYNCGECGTRCRGEHPFCDNGECRDEVPCTAGTTCTAGFCCGASCCGAGQLCCAVPGPITVAMTCITASEGATCPMGCLGCDCNAPDTPIATPAGARPIASLRAGDIVYSVDGSAIVPVPIALAVEHPVHGHHVVRFRLAGGATLHISASHPLADGRAIASLRAGDAYEGVLVEAAELVDYAYGATYDILPDSSSGVYFAAGLSLRSTLK